jgi:hypothetical protein
MVKVSDSAVAEVSGVNVFIYCVEKRQKLYNYFSYGKVVRRVLLFRTLRGHRVND